MIYWMILDEYLWYKRSILIDKKTIFLKSWNESDIKRISDVMKFNGLYCSNSLVGKSLHRPPKNTFFSPTYLES